MIGFQILWGRMASAEGKGGALGGVAGDGREGVPERFVP